MIRYALTIRESYEPIEKEKRAQVEENIAVGEAAPTYNKLKTSPPTARDTGTGQPAGLQAAPAQAGPQAQLAPQQGAMPPAAPPDQTEEVNLQVEPQPMPVPNTSTLNRTPSAAGKAKKKRASREELIDRLKKHAGLWGDIGEALHSTAMGVRSLPLVRSVPMIGLSPYEAERRHDVYRGLRAGAAGTRSESAGGYGASTLARTPKPAPAPKPAAKPKPKPKPMTKTKTKRRKVTRRRGPGAGMNQMYGGGE